MDFLSFDSNNTDETALPAAVSGSVQDLVSFGAEAVPEPGARLGAGPGTEAVPEPADGHGARRHTPAVPCADSPDAGDALVRAPGVVAAWSMDGPSLGHGARRRPAAVDERHLGRHMRQRVEDVPDVVVRAGCAAVAWSMDRGDWFLPRRIQSNTNPSDSVLLDVEEVPDSVEEVPDSVEEVLDINAVVHCPRCSTFHAGGVFGEACKQARRNARRCSRCGLLHEDYDFFAQVLDDMEKFDCEFYIPDVKKLQMSGNTIILPEEVIEKLEEREKKKQAKNNTKN